MISVITTTYNRADLIVRAISSVIRQTFSNWELIIIDDGSTDNTDEVVSQYLSDSRIKYKKKVNTGASDSRNIGAELAKGDFVAFLDSDDEVLPNWLEEVQAVLHENTGIACVGAVAKKPDGSTEPRALLTLNWYGKKIRVKFTGGSLFVRRSIFLAIKGYDLEIPTGFHTELGYRLLEYIHENNYAISSIDKELVIIYIHEGARQRNDWQRLNRDSIRFVNKFQDYFKKWDPKELSNHYSVIAYHYYKLNDKKQSLVYLSKAIRWSPLKTRNYLKIFKYALS